MIDTSARDRVGSAMRVLHIITGLAAGGAEAHLRLVLRHTKAEAEVVVLTNPGRLADAIRAEGHVVHELGMRGNADLMALPRLVRLIRRGRYDIVHTHLYRSCVYGRVAARLAGVATVVATEHSLGDEHIEGRLISAGIRRLYRATERLGTTTVAVSQTVARRLRAWGIPAERMEVISNGLHVDEFRCDPLDGELWRAALRIPARGYVVGCVGRLVPGKRVDAMLRALRGRPGVTALVVGDGPERAALTELARELGVSAVFTGETDAVAGLLSTMDAFVSTSAEETFGLAVLEALAAGLPVLYAACPALDELPLAVPGTYRLRRDLSDLPVALTQVINQGRIRLPAPRALVRYDIHTVAARVDDLYARLIQSRELSPAQWSPA